VQPSSGCARATCLEAASVVRPVLSTSETLSSPAMAQGLTTTWPLSAVGAAAWHVARRLQRSGPRSAWLRVHTQSGGLPSPHWHLRGVLPYLLIPLPPPPLLQVVVLDFVKPSWAGTTWGLGGTWCVRLLPRIPLGSRLPCALDPRGGRHAISRSLSLLLVHRSVNVGCIPKKLMHTAALLGESLEDARTAGWKLPEAGAVSHDWETLRTSVHNHVASLNWGYRTALRDKGAEYRNALGSFLDAHTIECVDKKGKRSTFRARRTVVAVGGRPKALEIPGEAAACRRRIVPLLLSSCLDTAGPPVVLFCCLS
jgi:hypothetical protein